MSLMLKSISMHRRDDKRIVQSNFITSCLAFKGSIPTPKVLPIDQSLLLTLVHVQYPLKVKSLCNIVAW